MAAAVAAALDFAIRFVLEVATRFASPFAGTALPQQGALVWWDEASPTR